MSAGPVRRRHSDSAAFDPSTVRNNAELRATGPGGFGVTIKGRDTIIMLLLALTLAAIVYFNHRQHQDIVDELSGLTYMISLPVEHRPALRPPVKLEERLAPRRQ